MSTRKVVRKSSKKASKPSHRPQAARTIVPGDSTRFTTAPETPVTVQRGNAQLYINGRDNGQVPTVGMTVGDFVRSHASEAGIRSFSVYLDGQIATKAMAGRSMSGFAKVEIQTKDARG